MCVLIFFTTFFCNSSHSKKNWARCDQKCILVFMYSARYSCQILMKLEFSRPIFEKHPNIKFHENLSSRRWNVPREQTDRHDKANSRSLQTCERAYKPAMPVHKSTQFWIHTRPFTKAQNVAHRQKCWIHKLAPIIDDVVSASQFCWILRGIWLSQLVSVHPCTATTKLFTHRAEIPARISSTMWIQAGWYQISASLWPLTRL